MFPTHSVYDNVVSIAAFDSDSMHLNFIPMFLNTEKPAKILEEKNNSSLTECHIPGEVSSLRKCALFSA